MTLGFSLSNWMIGGAHVLKMMESGGEVMLRVEIKSSVLAVLSLSCL